MTDQTTQVADVFVCFDANLPKIERCRDDCETKKSIQCIHRISGNVKIEFCNTKKFQGWSDLRIVTYFFGLILQAIAEGTLRVNSRCVILTKDRNFIDDVIREWKAKKRGERINLVFGSESIIYDSLTVFIKQIDCRNYGQNSRGDLKCSFHKINSLTNEA